MLAVLSSVFVGTALAAPLLNASAHAKGSPTCLGEDGTPVDYFYILKGPGGADTWYSEGGDFDKTDTGMEGSRGSVPWTLAQVYADLPDSYAYAMYNDQTDEGKTSAARAHAKGVVFFDGTQGFWLIHSLPKYPDRRSTGYKGLSDDTYGQSFICVTLPASALQTIGEQLQVTWPLYYDAEVTDDLEKDFPAFAAAALDDARVHDHSKVATLKTVGGKSFTHYAKSTDCACELYEDVVAPGLDSGLLVETWMNGRLDNKIETSCKGKDFDYSVQDIMNLTQADGTFWKETQDHSKWAVTDGESSTKAACVGDINRQYSQSKRGGGTLCLEESGIATAFNKLVKGIWEPC